MNCCIPPTAPGPERRASGSGIDGGGGVHSITQAQIPAGTFAMGDGHSEGYRTDGETPVHRVRLRGFTIDATAVTVADFSAFVADTGYITDAEQFGASAVFQETDANDGPPVPGTPWWHTVAGAHFRAPGGPGTIANADHPAVHVSYRDALAYCRWSGRRLPTEAQWEYAARGGLDGARYPWGDEHPSPHAGGSPRCNIFHGEFPNAPTAFVGTVPARSYAPNGYGLYQCVGNVWEWCADRFSARYYRSSPDVEPTGPERGAGRVLRGGSHLCHDSYCYRYRVAARSHNTESSTASNVGFRTVEPSR